MPSPDSILAAYRERVTVRRGGAPAAEARSVVYWMQRAQRAVDNPALELALELANELALPLVVYFGLVPYPRANLRHYAFMLEGLRETARTLAARDIGFVLRRHPHSDLAAFCEQARAALLVGDENPLREPERWRATLTRRLKIPFYTVDADVVVPSKLLEKAQYAARIIRPRLQRLEPEYLLACSNQRAHRACNPALLHAWQGQAGAISALAEASDAELASVMDACDWLDRAVLPVRAFRGGSTEAMRRLDRFVSHPLNAYPRLQRAPELDGTSQLSPYLHFGQISPVTVVLRVKAAEAEAEAKEKFLDQLVTWRELAVNFVRFNPVYDSIEAAEPWAHRTLAAHASDRRAALYSPEQLERALSGDRLWNAAQRQMLHLGWMHSYMRMYWAKKILEWSPSPQLAYRTALELNDRYFLDGRDPNGYAGLAWAILGKFDRPWFDRPVYGTIRYMSGEAAKKKFDTEAYILQMESLAQGAAREPNS